MVFIDYKKAYDSIHRTSLIKTLEEFGMPSKLISLMSLELFRKVMSLIRQ